MAWASAANAQVVLYGNLSATIADYAGVDYQGPRYNSFSTGSSPVTLTDVKLNLDLLDGPRGSMTVGLYSDSSHTPGTLLTVIGTLDDHLIAEHGGVSDFPVSPGFALTANTRYWIGVSTSNASLAGWATTEDTAGTGNIGNEYSCYTIQVQLPGIRSLRPAASTGGGTQLVCSQNIDDPYLMEITGTVPHSVPALSTWGMFGTALLLMACSACMIRGAQRVRS